MLFTIRPFAIVKVKAQQTFEHSVSIFDTCIYVVTNVLLIAVIFAEMVIDAAQYGFYQYSIFVGLARYTISCIYGERIE